MLPDERFGNRPVHTGASPLPITNPAQVPNPNAPNVPWTTPLNPPGQINQITPFTPPTAPATSGPGPGVSSAGAATLPSELIGDIPPPPIPAPPIVGPGVAGIRGTEAGTLARPGSVAAQPFRTSSYAPKPQRFGPGVPTAGGNSGVQGLGLDPESAAELLRQLAAGRQG